jgi:hypothetical protein
MEKICQKMALHLITTFYQVPPSPRLVRLVNAMCPKKGHEEFIA